MTEPSIRQGRSLLSLFAVLATLVPFSANAAIRGTVVDENGAPIAHAAVRAFPQETVSDRAARIVAGKTDREPLASAQSGDDGSFRVEVSKPVVELVVSFDGRAPFFADAIDSDDLGAILLPKAKLQSGRVTSGGKPVAGAIVLAGPSLARTANDGTFEMVRPATGALVRLTVFHPDFAATDSRNLALDRTADIQLTKGVAIRGRVTAADGRAPASHVLISSGLYASAESGEDGSFVIAHAPSSWQSLRAVAPGGAAFASRSGAAVYDLRLRSLASVSGSVRDPKTRVAVAGMRLTLNSQTDVAPETAITDSKGNFAFSSVPAGRYNISGIHPAMMLEAGGTMLVVSGTERQTTTLPAAPLVRVTGSVVDEDRKSVAAAIVAAQSGQSEIPRFAVTNAKGEFAIRLLSASAYLVAQRDGYITAIANPAEAGSRPLVITLRHGFPVTVKVVDKEQKPIERATVSFTSSRNGELPQAVFFFCDNAPCSTDSDGRFDVRLVPGTYAIGISGSSVVSKTIPSTKIDEKSSPLTLVADRGVTVSGRVVYSDGSPVPDTMIVLRAEPAVTVSALSDGTGFFRFTNAPRGSVTLGFRVSNDSEFANDGVKQTVNAPAEDVVLTMPPGGRIAGVVLDSPTRRPIPDFQIYTMRAAGMGGMRPKSFSSGDGSFTLEHLPAGRVDLSAAAVGYVRGTLNGVEVTDGKTTANVELRLDPAGRVSGRVTSRDGETLSGVYVSVMQGGARGGTISDSATTDSNGEFKLESVPPGDQQIAFSKQGYVRQEKSVESGAGKESRVDVVLDHGLEMQGRVIDESGQAVPMADVRAQATGDGGGARSDASGSFTIAGLRDLHYSLVARKNGYVEARIDDVVPASSGPLTLTLRRGGTVTGHVSGIPQGAAIMVSISGDRVWTSGRADTATGSFSIAGVPDGNFMAEAMASGVGSARRSARVPVAVVNGSAAPVEIAFVEGLTIQGHVTMQGKPASGAGVMFTPTTAAGQYANATVSADGSYAVNGVAAGDYRVRVNVPGGANVYNEPYTVTSSTVYDIDVRAGSLRGRVTDAESSAPLSNAQISVTNLDRKPVFARPVATDVDGAYVIDPIVEGRWRALVQRDGYRSETREVTIVGAATLDVQLSAAAKTTVRLVDATDGRPVSGFVSAMDSSKKTAFSGSTRSDGSIDLWLAPGTYFVRASAMQYFADPVTITTPGPDAQIPMQRSGRVVVRWTRTGVSMVQLRSVPPAAGVTGGVMMRSQTGAFENVRPGQCVVQLLGPDNKPLDERPVSVAGGQTATVVFP